MAESSDVTQGTDILEDEYNNLRKDVLSLTLGHTHSGTDSKTLATDSVDTAQIVALAVETAEIANNAVDTLQLANEAVDTTQLAADAVTPAKLGRTAGDNLIKSADTERNANVGSYTLVKEIELARGGTLRIKFDLKVNNATDISYGRVYRNGVAAGTEQTNTTTSYVTKSEDISGWTAGDLCQLYYKVDPGGTGINVYVENFRLYANIVEVEAVNTD